MNTDYRNSPLLNEEEKLLVRTMQRVRAGAGVVVLVGLFAAAFFTAPEQGPSVASSPDAAAQDAVPADSSMPALERGPAG
jgi:hypothetical protein